jgi:hypothetical protein
MKTFAQIISFAMLLLAGFTWFSNNIPQLRAEAPSEEKLSLEGLTPDSFAALGEKIFHGKANCPLCHNMIGHRAPLLDAASADGPPVAVRAADRIKDTRYKGTAKTAEEYIRESMLKPSVFVVAGFGKPGTNDTASPMPDVSAAPMSLTPVEVDAVIAFLQRSAGAPVTVPLPTGDVKVASADDKAKDAPPAKTMEEFAAKYECRTCHVIPGIGMTADEADIGPNLGGLSRFKGKSAPGGLALKDYVRQSILEPNKFVVKGYEPDTMPGDFAERLRVSELEMAVKYLSGEAREAK